MQETRVYAVQNTQCEQKSSSSSRQSAASNEAIAAYRVPCYGAARHMIQVYVNTCGAVKSRRQAHQAGIAGAQAARSVAAAAGGRGGGSGGE